MLTLILVLFTLVVLIAVGVVLDTWYHRNPTEEEYEEGENHYLRAAARKNKEIK